MPAVANIVLNDAQATPVAHTFIPLGPDANGVWWFEDQSASATIGYNRISVELKRPAGASQGANSANRFNRMKIRIYTPKMETLGNNSAGLIPPPTVAYIPYAALELVFPERASLQDRKDLRKFADFIFADANITLLAEQLQSYY